MCCSTKSNQLFSASSYCWLCSATVLQELRSPQIYYFFIAIGLHSGKNVLSRKCWGLCCCINIIFTRKPSFLNWNCIGRFCCSGLIRRYSEERRNSELAGLLHERETCSSLHKTKKCWKIKESKYLSPMFLPCSCLVPLFLPLAYYWKKYPVQLSSSHSHHRIGNS